VWLWRNGSNLFGKLSSVSASRRKLLGTLSLVGSAVLLLVGLLLVSSAQPKGAPSLFQWVTIAILGVVFVYAQTMAAAMLVSLGISQNSNEAKSPSNSSNNVGLSE
jgi:hypothetical protein